MRETKSAKIFGSSPDYDEINILTTKIGMLKNPHMHKETQDMPEAERLAAIQELEAQLKELLDFQKLPFNKFLNKP